MMRYTIEFELPDNETVLEKIKAVPVQWHFLGFVGHTQAKPANHAHWIVRSAEWRFQTECSKCGMGFEHMTQYCPHCGAKMDEVI